MSVEMYASRIDAPTLPRTGARGNRLTAERVVNEIDGAVRTLQCLSAGYLSGGQRCECTIDQAVVAEAWQRELAHGGTHGEGFFRFTAQAEQWLGYGLRDGTVRGVYCPTHGAERDQRAFASITGSDAAPNTAPAHA